MPAARPAQLAVLAACLTLATSTAWAQASQLPVTPEQRRVADQVARDLDKAWAMAEGDGNPPGPVYVEFPMTPGSAERLAAAVPALAGRTLSVLIWTTTPWTIPSNLAVAFNPELEYGAYPSGDRKSTRLNSSHRT